MMSKRPSGSRFWRTLAPSPNRTRTLGEPTSAEVAKSPVQRNPSPRVGAGVIGATQRSLSELREERDRLQALVDAGGGAGLIQS